MKITSLLLAGSLAANLALVAVVFLRPSSGPTRSAAAVPIRHASSDKIELNSLRAALESGDVAALTAAGVSPELIRILSVGRAFDAFQARMRAAATEPVDKARYWRNAPRTESPEVARNRRMETSKALREFSEALRLAYGADLESLFNSRDSRNSFLPPAKREMLRRIEQDYAELQSQIENSDGIELASDRQKRKLLQAEKDRDIAAALTPEERAELELHTSMSAMVVRGRYGDALETEEDYRKIYALQKAFDDRFKNDVDGGRPTPESVRLRREAQEKLQDDIRAALTPEQWATVQRSSDQDYRTIDSLTRRLNLPANTGENVWGVRDAVAAQSQQINANATLTREERLTQFQNLATKTQADLRTLLGAEGAEAYAQHSPWLRMLNNGTAFSTNPKDAPAGPIITGQTVYAVPPPGTPPARPTRGR